MPSNPEGRSRRGMLVCPELGQGDDTGRIIMANGCQRVKISPPVVAIYETKYANFWYKRQQRIASDRTEPVSSQDVTQRIGVPKHVRITAN